MSENGSIQWIGLSSLRPFPWAGEIAIEVFAEQIIDFTRHDIGSWLWWVIFPALLLLSLKKNDLLSEGTIKAILIRLVGGFILSAIVVALVSVWHLLGPQYFTQLRVEENSLALRYHWLREETVVPLREVTKLSVVRSGTVRRPCSRLRIETPGGTFRSFGFGRLDEDQVAVLDAARQKIAEMQTSQPPQQRQ